MKCTDPVDKCVRTLTTSLVPPDTPKALSHNNHWTDREGVVELTHNYGTENDPNYQVCTGNADHGKGFGHLCISVDNIQAACKRISDAGYKFQKRLEDGRMRSIAFALDPDVRGSLIYPSHQAIASQLAIPEKRKRQIILTRSFH